MLGQHFQSSSGFDHKCLKSPFGDRIPPPPVVSWLAAGKEPEKAGVAVGIAIVTLQVLAKEMQQTINEEAYQYQHPTILFQVVGRNYEIKGIIRLFRMTL